MGKPAYNLDKLSGGKVQEEELDSWRVAGERGPEWGG